MSDEGSFPHPGIERNSAAGRWQPSGNRRTFRPVLALFVLLSAAPDDPATILIEAARAAESRGDETERDQWLRGWASLGPQTSLPKGLEAPAAAAQTFIQTQGGLEVYTSRLVDRLRVGVHDPARVVFRVDAFAEVDGKQIRLTRLEGEAADRLDYRLPTGTLTLIVDVVAKIGPREIVLRRAIVAPATAMLPAAPDPSKAAARIDPRPRAEPAPVIEAEALTQWWWIAGGIVAAGLAGAAIWQETR
jgi:hypothetical protein